MKKMKKKLKKLFLRVTVSGNIPIWGGGMVGLEPSAAKSPKNALYGVLFF